MFQVGNFRREPLLHRVNRHNRSWHEITFLALTSQRFAHNDVNELKYLLEPQRKTQKSILPNSYNSESGNKSRMNLKFIDEIFLGQQASLLQPSRDLSAALFLQLEFINDMTSYFWNVERIRVSCTNINEARAYFLHSLMYMICHGSNFSFARVLAPRVYTYGKITADEALTYE